MRKDVVCLLVVAILAVSVAWSSAQVDSSSDELGDVKLEAFISAALAVDDVMDRWRPKIARSANDTQTAALREQANQEIRSTIERTDGISVVEYQRIRRIVAGDPDMLARITKLMRRNQDRARGTE